MRVMWYQKYRKLQSRTNTFLTSSILIDQSPFYYYLETIYYTSGLWWSATLVIDSLGTPWCKRSAEELTFYLIKNTKRRPIVQKMELIISICRRCGYLTRIEVMSDCVRCPVYIISVKQVWNGPSCIQILADHLEIGPHSLQTQMDEYRHGYLPIFSFKMNLNSVPIPSWLYLLSVGIFWYFFLT